MAETAICWFRRDLRVRDLPALAAAARAERTVPVFVLDDALLGERARWRSRARIAFMLGCLEALDGELRERGGRLVLRHGDPARELVALAAETGARTVHLTADVSPWARRRDARVREALEAAGVEVVVHPGSAIVDDPAAVRTKQGGPYSVFSPFARAWRQVPRRDVVRAPSEIALPPKVRVGRLPTLADLGLEDPRAEVTFEPGEAAGRRAVDRFLRSGLGSYSEARNTPSGGSSRTSPYLRWGCVSPLVLERRVLEHGGDAAEDFRTELAWRDFYAAVLVWFPHVTRQEFSERYRALEWADPAEGGHLEAWKAGRTGYPLVDAGMRQLLHEGWMHNRVRMVVGSFLTKDLHLDWRLGERWFMERLLDGDMAANNGGWQWIASVGTDPAPYFQRLFNPVTQQEKFDPQGDYVRRWVPELAGVPAKRLAKPWTMSEEEQRAAGCVIGEDYPAPIVDHAEERRRAVERYRAVA
jgi:deoxyribodipyrimidine photo-lyase